jgi:hypothetical protein
VSPNFRNFVPDANPTVANGRWTILGPWSVVAGDKFENGYGIRPTAAAGQPAFLGYQRDVDTGDMQVDLLMTPEKTEGTGFSVPGSPADSGERNLHGDIYIKYDPRTKDGYSLRFWRTIEAAGMCVFQFYKIEHGAGSPAGQKKIVTGVFKPTTHLILRAAGNKLIAHATNDVDQQTLDLEETVTPNRFGGAGVSWPRGSTNVYSRFRISYSGGK